MFDWNLVQNDMFYEYGGSMKFMQKVHLPLIIFSLHFSSLELQ
jgi:hypothetical protein